MNITLFLIALSLSPIFFSLAAKAQSETEEQLKNLMDPPYSDIMKAKAMIDKYTPEGQLYLVNEAALIWVRRALSPIRKEEWLNQTEFWSAIGGKTPQREKFLDKLFGELKASAEKKLPSYLPKEKYFAVHNAEEEQLMKNAISNFGDIEKVHNIGLAQKDWTIDKGNSPVPIARYKQGYIYAKYKSSVSGHNWCVILHINIIQDYAGGGTYGPSYGKYLLSELAGCPKK